MGSPHKHLITVAGVKAVKRVFERQYGARILRATWDGVDFVFTNTTQKHATGVKVFAYGFDPEKFPNVGGSTGIAEATLLAYPKTARASTIVAFADYILEACYWATLEELLEPSVVSDLHGKPVEQPLRHNNFGTDPQLLWSPLWFRDVLGRWEPLTPLEVESMRANRRPSSKSGLARIGRENEERKAFDGFIAARAAALSQGSLFDDDT